MSVFTLASKVVLNLFFFELFPARRGERVILIAIDTLLFRIDSIIVN